MAFKLFDRVKVNIATTGTGTVTFGSATDASFYTPAEAGAASGDTTTYVIQDGNNSEHGVMTFGASAATGARAATRSKIGGVVYSDGTKINLSGTAVLALSIKGGDVLLPDLSNASSSATARSNIYAAPFDALAYNGMQINGAMDVSQENGAAAKTISTGSQSIYALDVVRIDKTGTSVLSVQQVASSIPGFSKALRISVSTAQSSIGSDTVTVSFPIEWARFQRTMWGTSSAVPVSVGFWAKFPVAGTYTAQMINGAGTLAATATFVISANTPQYVTATFAAQTAGAWPTDNTLGARLAIFLAGATMSPNCVANTSYVTELTGVIILPGIELPSADRVPFILRYPSAELDVCRRYLEISPYNVLGGVHASGAFLSTIIPFKVQKRALPTVTLENAYRGSVNAETVNGVWTDGFQLQATATTASLGAQYYGTYKADARL